MQVRTDGKQVWHKVDWKYAMCVSCALAKSKQKNLHKTSKDQELVPGELIGMDISSIKSTSYGGSKFWLLVVDYSSDYCWSYFLKAKSEVGEKLLTLLRFLSGKGVSVQRIRCDNAG